MWGGGVWGCVCVCYIKNVQPIYIKSFIANKTHLRIVYKNIY